MRAPVEVEWFTATSACVGGSLLMLFSRFSGKMLTNGIPVDVWSKVECRSIVNFPDDSWRLSKTFSFMATPSSALSVSCRAVIDFIFSYSFRAHLIVAISVAKVQPIKSWSSLSMRSSGVVSLARISTFQRRKRRAENEFYWEKLGRF